MNYDVLTNKVKEYAHSLGADLVGVANIERFAKAPIIMSPQGILPTAKSVIVCSIHHPDACIELGGEPEPQDIGPYKIQYVMNDKLDMIAFKVARYLDDMGYKTIPIASSNIWRYRPYKELNAIFSPDISHIYAAVAAGLGEVGWHGITMTPEYGPRNRFISIITDAELTPTPMYNGPKLCDMCGECIRNCPTDAYRKEVNGVKILEIEDKKYKFANKNLWRCAWGEHFDLDLNLDIPDKVDEQVILDNVKKYGLRGGEFGVCLRVCLPPFLREKDPEYTRVYRRKRYYASADVPVPRYVSDKILEIADNNYIDDIGYLSETQLEHNGIELKRYLPDGRSVILFGVKFTIPNNNVDEDILLKQYKTTAQFLLDFTVLDVARELEKAGYSAVVKTDVDNKTLAQICRFDDVLLQDGVFELYESVVTSACLSEATYAMKAGNNISGNQRLTQYIEKICYEAGADLVGVSSVKRMNAVLEQLRGIKEDELILMASDKNTRFMSYDPSIEVVKRRLYSPQDYVEGAKSVIVVGLHYPEASVERAEQPPAEAVGPYVFAQYEVQRLLGHIGFYIVKQLQELGFNAVYSYDLFNIGSKVANPRGYQYDATCNAIEAVIAGLGELAYNGVVFTSKYGLNQRFVAIITDADLDETPIRYSGVIEQYCNGCLQCLEVCPTKALLKERKVQINIAGNQVSYIPVDTNRCDWSSKYALCGSDGFMYEGSNIDEIPPAQIDEQTLAQALKKTDPVLKHRPITAENCIVKCPLANGSFKR